MRVAVIGAGGVGSAAARFLASEGHAVTLLEQFTVDHDRGSSYGASRIIRNTYPDALYTGLMTAAYPLWDALERDAGEALLRRTGGLFFGRAAGPEMVAIRDALARHGVAHDVLDARDATQRFPQFRFAAGEGAVFEPAAGYLRASACVRANVALALRHGATLREHASVRAVTPGGAHVTLALADGATLEVDRVAVCAGPFAAPLLAPHVTAPTLPLTVTRQTYCHFATATPEAFAPERCPVWIDFDTMFYGFPLEPDTPGVKVALHRPGDPSDPAQVDRAVHERDRAPLRAYCRTRLPALGPDATFEKVCLYTNTPDEDFVVDTLPGEPRVCFVAGLSGHGFKFTVLLGRIAAWLAAGEPVPFDLARFRAARFARRPGA